MKRLMFGVLALFLATTLMIPVVVAQEPDPFPSEETKVRRQLVLVAQEKLGADVVLSNLKILDVHTGLWLDHHDVVIKGQRIAWIGATGTWKGNAAETVQYNNDPAVPGFIESHKHIESTHLTPDYEAALVLPFGNTTTMECSHELGNAVPPDKNVDFWLTGWKYDLPLKVFTDLPSAAPPTAFEFTAGYYDYDEIVKQVNRDWRVIALDEFMNQPALYQPGFPDYDRSWQVLQATWDTRTVVEGHGSGQFQINDINAFIAAGLSSDHSAKSTTVIDDNPAVVELRKAEAYNKLTRGIFLQLQDKNLQDVIPDLVGRGVRKWDMLAVSTDDKDASASLKDGTMNYLVAQAIHPTTKDGKSTGPGVPPEAAFAMASLNPARHLRIDHLVGSITPGKYADVIILREPVDKVDIYQVWASGQLVAQNGKMVVDLPKIDWPAWASQTMHVGRELTAADFVITSPDPTAKTVMAKLWKPFQFYFLPPVPDATLAVQDGVVQRDPENGITKFAIADRYHDNAAVAKIFGTAVGMSDPDTAIASSVAHDHHNIWTVGTSDEAMAQAVNEVARLGGGWALVSQGKTLATVRFEIGGLMTARPAEVIAKEFDDFWRVAEQFHWAGNGIPDAKRIIFATLTCSPWGDVLVAPFDTCPLGGVNVRTGECFEIVW